MLNVPSCFIKTYVNNISQSHNPDTAARSDHDIWTPGPTLKIILGPLKQFGSALCPKWPCGHVTRSCPRADRGRGCARCTCPARATCAPCPELGRARTPGRVPGPSTRALPGPATNNRPPAARLLLLGTTSKHELCD